MRFRFHGITGYHFSIAGMVVAYYGLLSGHTLAVWIGLTIVTIERLALALALAYVAYIHRQASKQMYDSLRALSDTLIESANRERDGLKKPYDQADNT